MKNSFEILSSLPEIKIRVWGGTLEDLFRNSLRGLAAYLRAEEEPAHGTEKIRQDIDVKAVDVNSLLVEFLSEVVARSDEHSAVFTGASFREFGENFLKGTLSGMRSLSPDNSIKAVSYSDIDIKKDRETGMYEATLVFDI